MWLLRMWLERACPASERWARKLGFTVQELDCGHDAMLADPDGLTKALLA